MPNKGVDDSRAARDGEVESSNSLEVFEYYSLSKTTACVFAQAGRIAAVRE